MLGLSSLYSLHNLLVEFLYKVQDSNSITRYLLDGRKVSCLQYTQVTVKALGPIVYKSYFSVLRCAKWSEKCSYCTNRIKHEHVN